MPQDAAAPDNAAATQPVSEATSAAPMAETYYKPVYVFHVRMADGTTGEWLLSAFDA